MAALSEEYLETDVGKVQLFRGGQGDPLVYLHSAAGEAVSVTVGFFGQSDLGSAIGVKQVSSP